MACVVAAPSKLRRPAGDGVKTDARDVFNLARLLKLDEIVAVQVRPPGRLGRPRRVGVRCRSPLGGGSAVSTNDHLVRPNSSRSALRGTTQNES
jgi:hypothetical protein